MIYWTRQRDTSIPFIPPFGPDILWRKLSEGYVIIHPAQFRVLVFRKGLAPHDGKSGRRTVTRGSRGRGWGKDLARSRCCIRFAF